MMKNILVNITTYKRPNELRRLITQLKEYNVTIRVWDDDPEGVPVEGVEYCKFSENYGKKLAWKKFRQIFDHCKRSKGYDYFIFLPDDVQLNNNFISDVLNTWKSINDEKKICLSLLVDNRIKKSNWLPIEPEDKGEVILTHWNDLCFICEKNFFKAFTIAPIDPFRWESNPLLSSGVGKQISNKLFYLGFNMYNMKKQTLKHLPVESKMNPEERKINPL